ncbi:probable G-protein coupled receptor 141 [Trichomycterus rosablanca]|uniref:probable G-protein coupled receptor 141 n=1 Tax=Trichomycterus rosablanca TaxID=2290929 RepID=UPI002F356D76
MSCSATLLNNTTEPFAKSPYRIALVIIYTVVLVGGSVGLGLMFGVLKSNMHSWTTIAFVNLIIAHFIFLVSVPFRIHYYFKNCWNLSELVCKLVSAMIHLHMHVVFIIYVIIFIIAFLHYYKKAEQIEFHRNLHAVAVSIVIWLVLLIVAPIILSNYGNNTITPNVCFKFGNETGNVDVYWSNIVLSSITVLVSFIVSCVLAIIQYSMIKKHGPALFGQQEFWAQMKNVSLALIIFICLVPYHLFRMYYLKNPSKLEQDNEVFLAITTFTCFDMLLVFAGRGICQRCGF